jgi:hypothetical protein
VSVGAGRRAAAAGALIGSGIGWLAGLGEGAAEGVGAARGPPIVSSSSNCYIFWSSVFSHVFRVSLQCSRRGQTMRTDEVIERICSLPADFFNGAKPMVQLVSASGIDACPAALTVANLSGYLTDHPELIEEWLRWSENKRVTSGWYFVRQTDHYIVGFHPKGESFVLADPALACAEFVTREVEAIMAVHAHR